MQIRLSIKAAAAEASFSPSGYVSRRSVAAAYTHSSRPESQFSAV